MVRLRCSVTSIILGVVLVAATNNNNHVHGFTFTAVPSSNCYYHCNTLHHHNQRSNNRNSRSSLLSLHASTKGFGGGGGTAAAAVKEQQQQQSKTTTDVDKRPLAQIKQELLELLPRMTGQENEFRQVERLVNALEGKYVPAQTLGFLNLAMSGEWQLLFSTNYYGAGIINPSQFRLRELFQRIETDNLRGNITNQALWDLAEDQDNVFDATGTFSVVCSYSINQGARMVVDLQDHVLKPSRGSKIPQDVQGLVGRLHRAMPKEMFDPQDHAVDTTYLDADLRIVRMTGPRLEGVRDIFIRRGGLEINPTKNK